MTTYADIKAAHDAIKARSECDANLAACSGYSFNWSIINGAPADAVGPVDAIIMGMNPGEDPTREDGLSRTSASKWERLCQSFANSVGGRWAVSEMFFWSSHDLSVLRKRVGDFGPYLDFCANLNRLMIDFHRPKIIFQPGLGWGGEAVKYYGLRHRTTVKHVRKRGRLLEHYEMPDGTPWLTTAHWTSSFGFSKDDQEDIKAYATKVIGSV